MGLLYNIGIRVMNLIIFFLIVILMPGIPPFTTFPYTEFDVKPPKELRGALEPNFHLEGAERLLEGRVYGPECLIVKNNEIYTGIHGGEVIKISAKHITHVVKIGQPCEDVYEEARCGRPLGMAFDTIGNNLIIADAYYGIWEVDMTTYKKKLLISPNQELPGMNGVNRKAKIFNSVAVDSKGDIYWTDSSSDFTVQDLVFTSFANPSGRLFKYDRKHNTSKVLVDNLYFANGIALSPDEAFIVVAETGAMRLLRVYLQDTEASAVEVFAEGLPGLPDNLTPDADGLWVPLVMAADKEHPSTFSMFTEFPNLRIFFARLLSLIEFPFRFVQKFYPNKICERFVHFIGHGESITFLAPKRATIVRLDWKGNILGSLHGFDKSVGSVSHVLEYNDYLLLGSPFNRFLARVKSPKTSQQYQVKIKNVKTEGIQMEPVIKTQAQTQTQTASSETTTKTTGTTTTTTTKTTQPTTTTKTTQPTTTTTTTTTTPKPTTTTTTTSPPTTTTTTTTTTPKPTTTTTPKPTTTTPKPTTATTTTTTKTTPPPTTTTTTTTTPKQTTTTPKPTTTTTKTTAQQTTTTTTKRAAPKEPAPIVEPAAKDELPPPKTEKLKVINKNGQHVEL